jgi:hypothetical protein
MGASMRDGRKGEPKIHVLFLEQNETKTYIKNEN